MLHLRHAPVRRGVLPAPEPSCRDPRGCASGAVGAGRPRSSTDVQAPRSAQSRRTRAVHVQSRTRRLGATRVTPAARARDAGTEQRPVVRDHVELTDASRRRLQDLHRRHPAVMPPIRSRAHDQGVFRCEGNYRCEARSALCRLREENGATAIIVALCLIALFGMLVLVVDVGGLLWQPARDGQRGGRGSARRGEDVLLHGVRRSKRRRSTRPTPRAVSQRQQPALSSNASRSSPIPGPRARRTDSQGYVTVAVLEPPAAVLRRDLRRMPRTITTPATAAVGPAGAERRSRSCSSPASLPGTRAMFDQPPDIGTECSFWYDNTERRRSVRRRQLRELSISNTWNVPRPRSCNNPGEPATFGDYILNNYGSDFLSDNPTPPTSAPGRP